ncbi:MAG: rod shape-determining protein MreC [Coriobacteriia bacterium]|nr:rod shape-determining protein MreC [Coriobacteriia bacterium]
MPAWLSLVACCLCAVVLLTFWMREPETGALHSIRDKSTAITAPLLNAGAFITTPLRAMTSGFDSAHLSEDEYQQLISDNETLRSENVQLQEYQQENDRLSALLGLKDAYGLESTGARVISQSLDSWNRTITINKGSQAGLRAGMPVMNANGLIGQTESVGPDSSLVRLITDEQSAVGVFVQSNRVEGILTGSSDGTLYLRYVGVDSAVKVGDNIITSGAGGVYPKGITVGTVYSVDFQSTDIYQTIVVHPITKVDTYEEVLVVTGSEATVNPGDGTSGTGADSSAATGTATGTATAGE